MAEPPRGPVVSPCASLPVPAERRGSPSPRWTSGLPTLPRSERSSRRASPSCAVSFGLADLPPERRRLIADRPRLSARKTILSPRTRSYRSTRRHPPGSHQEEARALVEADGDLILLLSCVTPISRWNRITPRAIHSPEDYPQTKPPRRRPIGAGATCLPEPASLHASSSNPRSGRRPCLSPAIPGGAEPRPQPVCCRLSDGAHPTTSRLRARSETLAPEQLTPRESQVMERGLRPRHFSRQRPPGLATPGTRSRAPLRTPSLNLTFKSSPAVVVAGQATDHHWPAGLRRRGPCSYPGTDPVSPRSEARERAKSSAPRARTSRPREAPRLTPSNVGRGTCWLGSPL